MRGAVAVSGELPGAFWDHQVERRAPGAVCVLLSWSHGTAVVLGAGAGFWKPPQTLAMRGTDWARPGSAARKPTDGEGRGCPAPVLWLQRSCKGKSPRGHRVCTLCAGSWVLLGGRLTFGEATTPCSRDGRESSQPLAPTNQLFSSRILPAAST